MLTTLLLAGASIQAPAWAPTRGHAWNESATAALAEHLRDGKVILPSSSWIITAKNPD